MAAVSGLARQAEFGSHDVSNLLQQARKQVNKTHRDDTSASDMMSDHLVSMPFIVPFAAGFG